MHDTEEEGGAGAIIVTPKVALAYAVGISLFFFLLDDLIGWAEGGGIFSVGAALNAAGRGAATIDVDRAGLRTFFVMLCTVIVMVAGAILRVNLKKRLVSFAMFTLIIGGGFVLDVIYDDGIVGHMLADRGYSRCPNSDFSVGSGKGKVWFEYYVLRRAQCPATPRRS